MLESLLDKCDSILLGGGMIFTFYRARGLSTGSSMVEEEFVDMARDLMDKAEAKGVKLKLPRDVIIADKFAADAASKQVSVIRLGIVRIHAATRIAYHLVEPSNGPITFRFAMASSRCPSRSSRCLVCQEYVARLQ